MQTFLVLLVSLTSVLAGPTRNGPQRIVGGDLTTIDQHPYIAAMLVMRSSNPINFQQSCGGTILNQRTILSAAHCYSYQNNDPSIWRIRVGSSFSNSGGVVHNVARIINFPQYDPDGFDHDISVIHLATSVVYNNLVQAAHIPGPNYVLPENTVIWSSGYGQTAFQGVASVQLKHVQLRVDNQEACARSYPSVLTPTMLCLRAASAGHGTCQQDSGGPNIHRSGGNNVVVGVTAFGNGCGEADVDPDVTARVSSYSIWIQENQFVSE
ncbi:trypsin domain-containing protein [Phthorimaea operculella]|nr:trypsin domain-containing protein [Phthorimaea operculella]